MTNLLSFLPSFEQALGKADGKKGNDYDFRCPFCLKKGRKRQSHLHVNFVKGKALCHGCGAAFRNLKNLLRVVGGSFDEIDEPSADVSEILKMFAEEKQHNESLKLPEEYNLVFPQSSSFYNNVIYSYLRRRAVTDEQIENYSLGYCQTGRYSGMVIIPVYMRSELVFFTTRRLFGQGGKTLNPEIGDSKRYVLLGYERCLEHKPDIIYVVEGPFDLFALERAGLFGVAVMGSTITAEQCALLSKLPSEICVAFDPDAHEKVKKYVQVLYDNCPNTVSTLLMTGHEDFNDMAKKGKEGLKQIRRIVRQKNSFGMASMLSNML